MHVQGDIPRITNVTDLVAIMGTSATLSQTGVDPLKEIGDIIETLERVLVERYASGFKTMFMQLAAHIVNQRKAAEDAGQPFDWLPVAENWAFDKLDGPIQVQKH